MKRNYEVAVKVAQAFVDADLIPVEQLIKTIDQKSSVVFIPYDGRVFEEGSLQSHVDKILENADIQNVVNIPSHFSGFSNGFLFDVWVS